jgi:hypothetical protein
MENYIEAVKSAKQNHYLMCYSFALTWIKGKEKFTSEDLIEDYFAKNNNLPKEKRVFGAVIRELLKYKFIEHSGYSVYKNKAGHGKPINVWKSLI